MRAARFDFRTTLGYDTRVDVDWEHGYIGVIQAKPSKTSDRKAASSSALWSFSACAGTEHLLVRQCFLGVGLDVSVLIGRLRVVAEPSQICFQMWLLFCARSHATLSTLQLTHHRNTHFMICCGIAASFFFWASRICCCWTSMVSLSVVVRRTHIWHCCQCRHDEQASRGSFFVCI